jgi:hypothetical protein
MPPDSLQKPPGQNRLPVKAVTPETFVCLLLLCGVFFLFSSQMGVKNLFSTVMKTSFDLLINTAFFIMAVAVIAGALSGLLSEFGVIALINRMLSPLMKPLYGLPGAAALGVVTTFLSDNPAIVVLSRDQDFIKYFTLRQKSLLTNLGTTFGMGLIVITVMIANSTGNDMLYAVAVGFGSACAGSVVSVRLMDFFVKRHWGARSEEPALVESGGGGHYDIMRYRLIREGNFAGRALNSILDGGKNGVEIGFAIVPGILVICTTVMLLVFGPPAGGEYTGGMYEGIYLIPLLAGKIDFILQPLFGFTTPEAIAFPCTAIGAVGAALGMVPGFLAKGLIGPNDIAVFTAMGMTWSGYLSTHVSMLDALGVRELTGKAILSHTAAGVCAGVIAHWAYVLVVM